MKYFNLRKRKRFITDLDSIRGVFFTKASAAFVKRVKEAKISYSTFTYYGSRGVVYVGITEHFIFLQPAGDIHDFSRLTKEEEEDFWEQMIINNDSLLSDEYLTPEGKRKPLESVISRQLEQVKTDFKEAKNRLLIVIDKKQKLELLYKKFASNIKNLGSQYKVLSDGSLELVFKDVVAEDTDVDIDDIHLGDIKWNINFENTVANIVDGDKPRRTRYNRRAFHPHHLSSGCCFGSLEADIAEAIKEFDTNKLFAYLYQFTHHFTSSDSAGEEAELWIEDSEKYIELHNGDRCLREEAFEFEGVFYHESDGQWSDTLQTVIPWSMSTYSEELETYILDLDSNVQLENGRGTVPEDYEDMEEIEGRYYHYDDLCSSVNGESIPQDDAVPSYTNPGLFIHKDNAFEYEGGWYTEDEYNEIVEQNEEA